MAGALVSIVVNNFNYARYLSQTIDSALSQTHPHTEVVVVDDASTDDSRSVIHRYGDRIVPVLLDQNGGQGAAMNAGFRKSRGEIVIFLDADDYLYPQAAERVVAAWRPGISKLQYRLHLVDGQGNKIDLFPAPEIRFDSGDVVPLLLAAGRYETTVTSGNAFSRGALEKTLPIPQEEFRIAADGYLVTLVPFFGPVLSLEEPLGAYRQHGQSAWSAGRNGLDVQMRHALVHDAHRYDVLRDKALKLGLELVPSPGLQDHGHLTARISSLCLDPKQHPHAGDSRLALALRGVLSSRHARLPWKRRAILAAWFVAMGILPRQAASKVAAWRMVPASRPLRPLFKVVRRLAE
jgi:hypothetical protein